MLQPKTITIDGVEFILGHWDVKKALETWAWLLESLGEAAGEVFKIVAKDLKADKEDPKPTDLKNLTEAESERMLEAFGTVVSILRKNIPSDEYSRRMIDFCSDVAGPNGPLKPPFMEFRGKLLTMHKLVVQILAFQYQDFLDAGLSLFKE